MNTWNGEGPKHRPIYDAENNPEPDVSAFVEQETRDTYNFLWRGIKLTLIFAGSIALAAALTITIWKAATHG